MASPAALAMMARIEALQSWKNLNGVATLDGSNEGNLAKTVLDMEIYVSTLINDLPMTESNVQATIESMMKEEVEGPIDGKLRTAVHFAKSGTRDEASSWYKSAPESKAVQEIGVVDAKQYRQWNKQMKNALDQIRPNYRHVPDCVEKLTEEELNEANRRWSLQSRETATRT